jgi:DNA-binding MarR family transcriptional regulator
MEDKHRKPSKSFTLEEFIPYRLALLAESVSTAFSKTYTEQFGITVPQWRVMAAIGRDPHCKASSIVEHAALDKVQVSRAVSGLMEMGHLESYLDENDRRSTVLSFSQKGQSVYNQIVPAGLDFEAKLMSIMSTEDFTQLDRLFTKLALHAKKL